MCLKRILFCLLIHSLILMLNLKSIRLFVINLLRILSLIGVYALYLLLVYLLCTFFGWPFEYLEGAWACGFWWWFDLAAFYHDGVLVDWERDELGLGLERKGFGSVGIHLAELRGDVRVLLGRLLLVRLLCQLGWLLVRLLSQLRRLLV